MARNTEELIKDAEEVADRLNGFHATCCDQCDENYKNSMADAKLIAELSAKLRESEWRPIETIPEGVHVNIYIGDGNTINTHEFLCCSSSDMIAYMKKATHWQTLPTPPKKEKADV